MKDEELEKLAEIGFSLIKFVEENLLWVVERSHGRMSLTASWSLIERSFQTVIYNEGVEISRTSSEGMKSLSISDNGILAHFDLGEFSTKLSITNGTPVNATWETIES